MTLRLLILPSVALLVAVPLGAAAHLVNGPGTAATANIYLVSMKTGGVRDLTSSATDERSPTASPDGRKVAFVASLPTRRPDIWSVSLDGTDFKQLTFTDKSEFSPSWAPRGNRIAFRRDAACDCSRRK